LLLVLHVAKRMRIQPRGDQSTHSRGRRCQDAPGFGLAPDFGEDTRPGTAHSHRHRRRQPP
jgi:hypothetical protein